jgi:hypothetical protein
MFEKAIKGDYDWVQPRQLGPIRALGTLTLPHCRLALALRFRGLRNRETIRGFSGPLPLAPDRLGECANDAAARQ